MSSPVTEIVVFSVFPEADLQESAKICGRQNGFLDQYYGHQVENAGLFVWLLDWENVERHEAFIQNKTEYGLLFQSLQGKMLGDPQILHVHFKPYPAVDAFLAPVVSILKARLKPNVGDDRMGKIAEAVIEHQRRSSDMVASAWGPLVEDPSCVIIATGWKVPQLDQVRVPEAIAGSVDELEVYHVRMKRW